MNRIREGYALVRNPVAKNVVYKVDMSPRNTDILILMTKDPRPMVPHLDELKDRGISVGFQVSITPYGRDIEPGVPDKADVTEAFRKISNEIGRDRMVWRYDPVILNGRIGIEYHRRKFDLLCRELAGYTDRCIFSFVEMHDKLGRLRNEGILRNVSEKEANDIGEAFSGTACENGMELSLCCSEFDLSRYGISSRGCIDGEDMKTLGVPFEKPQAPIRERCACVKNIDIGEYDTCGHDCIYCYANRNTDAARKQRRYDPGSGLLYGSVRGSDVIVELETRKTSKITDF
jgi:hypothetical protein